MAEKIITSRDELFALCEEFTREQGGESFNNELTDNMELERRYGARGGQNGTHNRFEVQRFRDDETEGVTDTVYIFHEGTTKRVEDFPDEVYHYGDLEDDELKAEAGEENILGVNDCTSYEVNSSASSIEVVRLVSFILNESVILAVPWIRTGLVYDADDVDSLRETMTSTKAGISVVEYDLPGFAALPVQEQDDDFSSIVAGLSEPADRLDEHVEHMFNILEVIKHGY